MVPYVVVQKTTKGKPMGEFSADENLLAAVKRTSKVPNIGKAPKKRKCWRPPRKEKEKK